MSFKLLSSLRNSGVQRPVLSLALSRAYLRDGASEKGLELLDEVLALDLRCVEAYETKGTILLTARKFEEVESLIRQARSQGISSYGIEKLGVDLSLRQRDPARALGYLRMMADTIPVEMEEQRKKLAVLEQKIRVSGFSA